MSYLAKYFDTVRSEEAENDIVQGLCESCETPRLVKHCEYIGDDKLPTPSYSPYFEGRPASSGEGSSDYRCWLAQPQLILNQEPYGFRGDRVVSAMAASDCVNCKESMRMKLRAEAMVKPDYRFWLGVGAASAGLLLALTVGIRRR